MTQFTAITPPDMSVWLTLGEDLLMDAVNQACDFINDDFMLTIQTWKSGPTFVLEKATYVGSNIEGSVSTDNPVYGYIVRGTSPHEIRPVKAKKLHFMSGYTAKTTVRVIGSQSGGASGGDVFAQSVHHPGSAARDFDLAIQEKRQRDFESLVADMINQAASKI